MVRHCAPHVTLHHCFPCLNPRCLHYHSNSHLHLHHPQPHRRPGSSWDRSSFKKIQLETEAPHRDKKTHQCTNGRMIRTISANFCLKSGSSTSSSENLSSGKKWATHRTLKQKLKNSDLCMTAKDRHFSKLISLEWNNNHTSTIHQEGPTPKWNKRTCAAYQHLWVRPSTCHPSQKCSVDSCPRLAAVLQSTWRTLVQRGHFRGEWEIVGDLIWVWW